MLTYEWVLLDQPEELSITPPFIIFHLPLLWMSTVDL